MREEKEQVVSAILFSANPNMVVVDDARNHLDRHQELYWEVGFAIAKDNFVFPIYGFIHVCGGQVEYRATIRDIIPFSPSHYEDGSLAPKVKPKPWIREWKENIDSCRSHTWKNALVITEIVPFSYDTYALHKCDGTKVLNPPQGYIRILPPDRMMPPKPQSSAIEKKRPGVRVSVLAERNLEDLIVQQLDAIEPGLQLIERQLSTPAGRLDLLCKDPSGCYVMVELKRLRGSDEVVGQILRYMGWFKEAHPKEKIRGIIVVGKQDQALSYATKAVPDIRVKEFKLQIVDAT